MKVVRILMVSAAVVAVLVVVVAILAMSPSVQTWAARRALSQQPDMRGDVSRVAVGLKKVDLTGLSIRRPGMLLTVPSGFAELPVTSAAGKRVLIHNLVAKGWILDFTVPTELGAKMAAADERVRLLGQLAVIGLAQTGATPPAREQAHTAAQPFEGIFKLLNLPIDLELDAAELEGDVIFPTQPGQPPGRAHVTLNGGQLGAGKTGEFKIVSQAKLAGTDAPVSDLTLNGTLQARMDTPRTFERLTIVADVVATGPKFPKGAKLRLDTSADRAGKTEEYVLDVRSGETATAKQVADVRASFPIDSKLLTGTWKIDATDAELAPFALGIAVPVFAAVGEGRFQTDQSFGEVHASGRFETTLDKLETLSAPLATLGHLRLKGDFDLVQHENAIRVERLSAVVEGANPLVSIQALQPIELNTASGELKVADPAKDLLRVKLDGVPLAWAQPFVQDMSIGGDDLKGEFIAKARDGGFAVRSASPLTIGNLTVTKAGQPMLKGVDVSLAAAGDYSPKTGWQADVSEFSLREGPSAWLVIAAKVGQLPGKDQPIKATGQYQIDLPGALHQPILAEYRQLSKGRAAGDFSAVVTTALKQIAAKLELRDLASPQVTQPIPSITLNVRADLHSEGLIKVQAPILVQQGDRKSDLEFTAEVRPVGAKQTIDAQVVSNLLYVEDVQVLAAPFQGVKTAPAKPTAPAPKPAGTKTPAGSTKLPGSTAPDTQPFWSGVNGELRLALKKVIYSPDVQAADVSGAIKIGADAVTLQDVRAAMGEGSSAKIDGGLTFDPKSKEPYALKGDINVTNLNPGPILALLSPQRQPTAEGQFDMVGKFSGEAKNPDELADKTSADLKLTSRGGKFHGFAASARGADVSKYQKTASTAATLLGIAAGIMGENKIAAQADRVRAVSDVLKRFAEIDFDQLNLEVTHRPGEATKIKDFSLISPELRLIGNGGIENTPGVSWLERPLHLEVQMAVRGDQAKDMRVLGLLAEQKDPLGYAPLLDKFPIDGTLSNLGTQALSQLLTKVLGE